MRGAAWGVTLLALLQSGCVSRNLETLQTTAPPVVLSSPMAWEDAYRVLNTRLRECLDLSGLGHTGGVDGQLYAERRVGEIVVSYQRSPLTNDTGPLAMLQVRPSAAGGSSIELRVTPGLYSKRLPAWTEKWLDGATNCRP